MAAATKTQAKKPAPKKTAPKRKAAPKPVEPARTSRYVDASGNPTDAPKLDTEITSAAIVVGDGVAALFVNGNEIGHASPEALHALVREARAAVVALSY